MSGTLSKLVEKKMGPVAKELQDIKNEMKKQTKILLKMLKVLENAK